MGAQAGVQYREHRAAAVLSRAFGGRLTRGRVEQDRDRSAGVTTAVLVGIRAGGSAATGEPARSAAGRSPEDGRADQQMLQPDPLDRRRVQSCPRRRAQRLQRPPRVDFHRESAVLRRNQDRGVSQRDPCVAIGPVLVRSGRDQLHPGALKNPVHRRDEGLVPEQIVRHQQCPGPVHGRPGSGVTADGYRGPGIEHPGAVPVQQCGRETD